MFIPELQNDLLQLAKNAQQKSRKAGNDVARRNFILRVNLIDPDLIEDYVVWSLSDTEYASERFSQISAIKDPQFQIEDLQKNRLLAIIRHQPEVAIAFNIIREALSCYFQDLQESTRNRDKETHSEAKGFEGEAETNALVTELLPKIILGIGAKNPFPMEAEDFSKGLKHAFGMEAFGESIGCPFGRKVASIFAINPIRLSSGEVNIGTKEPGALPAFICREVKNSILKLKQQKAKTAVYSSPA